MAISNSGIFGGDIYDGQRYYSEQERRYREEMERQRMMQQMAYNPYTNAAQANPVPPPPQEQPKYTTNKKLLLLEN